MEGFEDAEKFEKITLVVEGEKVLFEQVPTDEGIRFNLVAGDTKETDEPGAEVLVVSEEDDNEYERLDPAGDLEASGLGTQRVYKNGVTLDISITGGFITGPDTESIKNFLRETRFGYSNTYDV